MPVLTAVGELDGLTVSFVFRSFELLSPGNLYKWIIREWKESQEAEDLIGMPGRFPVHVIDDANHGQVTRIKNASTESGRTSVWISETRFKFNILLLPRWPAVTSQHS